MQTPIMRKPRRLPLTLLALGLLAGASRAQADRGASAWFLNLSGEDREVIYNGDKVP